MQQSENVSWLGEASGGRFSVTVGNNVCAHDNPNNNPARSCEITEAQTRPDGGPELDFVYEFDQTTDPTLQVEWPTAAILS